MIFKTNSKSAWELTEVVFYGQKDDMYIFESSEAPDFDYVELDEDYNDFDQRCVCNIWEDTYQPTIAELKTIKGWIEALGEEANELKTYEGLKLAYENKLLQEEIDTLAMAVLSLMEV